MNDVELLALLVHKKVLDRDAAQELFPRLQAGESLDALLEDEVGWSAEEVARVRRTRAGTLRRSPASR